MDRTQIKAIDKIAVLFVLLVSGTTYFFMFFARYSVSLFFLFSIYFFLKKKGRVGIGNIIVVSFILLFFLLNYFFLNTDHWEGNSQIYTYCMLAIASFCIYSKMPYIHFKWILLRLVFLLALISIILFIGVETGFFVCSEIRKGNSSNMVFLFHNFGWFGYLYHRLAGLYWEPGAYQIVLNTTLLLYLKDFCYKLVNRREKRMLYIILIASLLTQSTASYLVLGVLIICYTYINIKVTHSKNVMQILLFVIIAVCSIYVLFRSEVVTEKLSQKDIENSSYEIRKRDNLGLLVMISQKPFIGFGLDTKQFITKSRLLQNSTSSNGILYYCAVFGIPFVLVLLIRIYYNIKQFNIGLPLLLTFTVFILINSFEVYLYFPLMYIFIYSFLKNRKPLSCLEK